MQLLTNLFKFIHDRLRHEQPARRVTCEWCARPIGCCDCEERIACKQTGIVHLRCGWCGACEVPMFLCQQFHWQPRPDRKVTYKEIK